jgi:hypothetical protein
MSKIGEVPLCGTRTYFEVQRRIYVVWWPISTTKSRKVENCSTEPGTLVPGGGDGKGDEGDGEEMGG